jgi:predicted acyl esterase
MARGRAGEAPEDHREVAGAFDTTTKPRTGPGTPNRGTRREQPQILTELVTVQLAAGGAQRPPALKAVVAIYASDDRYTDDVHYAGGALKLLDLVDYPLYMVALNALPPVPAVAGADWRARWRERVEGLEPWLLRWLEEQVDGPYWRQGSLRPGYERIACPTMLVAGWADGYRNATFRVMERLRAPARLLFGPWSHMATDTSVPGPRMDLVPEMVRWWDRWLRGHRNGVEEGSPVTVFVRHSTRPAPDLDEQPGVWRDEPAWPPERSAQLASLWAPGPGRSASGPAPPPGRSAPGPGCRARASTGWRCGRTSAARPGSAAPATCPGASRTTSGPTTPGR